MGAARRQDTVLGPGLALLGLLALLPVPTRAAECEIALSADAASSLLDLGGGAAGAPLVTPPSTALGLQGGCAVLLAAACPGDADSLVGSLVGAVLEASPGDPLELFPSSIQARVGGLATVDIAGVTVGLRTSPLQAAGASGGVQGQVQLAATLNATLLSGAATVSAPMLSPTPIPVNLAGLAADNATQVWASAQGGLARLELRDLHLSFRYTLAAPGSPAGIPLLVELTGDLVLLGAVGCPGSCGDHGRCWLAAGTNATAEAGAALPACECECGWAGTNCSVPSGFCPRYPSESLVPASVPSLQQHAPSPLPPPTAPASTTEQSASCITPNDCNTHQQYDATTRSCVCLPGWQGPRCEACRADDACEGLYGEGAARCRVGDYRFSPQSPVKVCTCLMQGLEQFLRPSLIVHCNTSAPAPDDPSSGRYCQLDMELAQGGAVGCRMSRCSFQAGSTQANCAHTHCECASACPAFQPLIQLAEGNPAVLDCDPSSGICTTDIKGFLVVVPAACTVAECLVAGYALEQGVYTVPSENLTAEILIAAAPLACLTAVVAGLALLLARHRRYWAVAQRVATAVDPKKGDDLGLPGPPAQLQVQPAAAEMELRFERLACAIPWRHGNVFGRAVGTAEGEAAQVTHVLRGVSGVARTGEVVGVLGPSGCGKTTLLALLSGSSEYLSPGAVCQGYVLLNGAPLTAGSGRKVAFLPQDDVLLPTLTVGEHLLMHAMLRLPATLTPQQAQDKVGRVIAELGLHQVAGSRVGSTEAGRRGISGGERRRVSIGQELVAVEGAAVLLLDEPSSGLDSHAALHLMQTLKQVARAGRIVLLSSHQPSPPMFALLDRAYLLAGGVCVFAGPPDAVRPRFAALGLPCPAEEAPAERMLEVVSDPQQLAQLLQAASKRESSSGGAADMQSQLWCSGSGAAGGGATAAVSKADVIGQHAPHQATQPPAVQLAPAAPASSDSGGTPPLPARRCYQSSRLSRELAVMFWRTLADILRNPSLLLLHWGVALAMGLLMGCIFWQVESDMSGVQNRGGGIYATLAVFAFTALTTTDLLTAERRLVAREVQGGYCHPWTYLLAKATADGLLLRVIPALLYSLPFYYMMGLQTGSSHVALFLFTVATFALAVAALSLAVTSACSTAGKASLVLTFILLVSLLVGGFLVNVDSIPGWIAWLHYLSLFFYAYDILTTNEVATLQLSIQVKGYKACTISNAKGAAVLSTFGIDASRLTTWVVVLDCLYAAALLLALATLYHSMPRRIRQRATGAAGQRSGGFKQAQQPAPPLVASSV